MTYDANPPQRPIGALRISTIALFGVIAAVSVPAVATAIAVSNRVENQQAQVAIAASGAISKVVVRDSESDIRIVGDPQAGEVSGHAVVQWKGKNGKRAELRQSLDDGVLTLSKDCSSGGCGSIDITIRVPAAVAVQATSSNGEISVSDVTGAVNLSTTSGNLQGFNLGSGDASFKTTDGNVDASFQGAPARIRVNTTNGNVTLATDGKTAYYDSISCAECEQSLSNRQDRWSRAEIDVTTSNATVIIK
jgi:hypothetical protein